MNRHFSLIIGAVLIAGCSDWDETDFSTPMGDSPGGIHGMETGTSIADWNNQNPAAGMETASAYLRLTCNEETKHLWPSIHISGADSEKIEVFLREAVGRVELVEGIAHLHIQIRFDDEEVVQSLEFSSYERQGSLSYNGAITSEQEEALEPVLRVENRRLFSDIDYSSRESTRIRNAMSAQNLDTFLARLGASTEVVVRIGAAFFTWGTRGADSVLRQLRQVCDVPPADTVSLTLGPAVPTGEWSGYEWTDDITGRPVVIASLSSESTIDNVSLTARCKDNRTELYINWSDYIPSGPYRDPITVTLRFDDEEESVTRRWSGSEDSTSTFAPAPIDLLKQMLNSEKMVATVRYSVAGSGRRKTAVFNTEHGWEDVGYIADACNWILDRGTAIGVAE